MRRSKKENCKACVRRTKKRRNYSQLERPFRGERLSYESLCSINLYHAFIHLQSRLPALLSNSLTLAIQFSTLFSSKSLSNKNYLTFYSWKGLGAIYSAVQSLTTGFRKSLRAIRQLKSSGIWYFFRKDSELLRVYMMFSMFLWAFMQEWALIGPTFGIFDV